MTDDEVLDIITQIVRRKGRQYAEDALIEALAAQCMIVGFAQELLASGQGGLVWPGLERGEQIAEALGLSNPGVRELAEKVVTRLVNLRGAVDSANPETYGQKRLDA
jgi:hypothetical protein